MKNEALVDVMNGLQNTSQTPARTPRPVRLSPELNEFLHVMDALEGKLGNGNDKPAKG